MARIQVSNDPSGRIIVSFPCAPLLASKVKTMDGPRWHPAEKHWSFPNKNGILEKILEVLGSEELQIDPALKTATSKVKNTPSPLAGEGQGEGYHFEDLRRELLSRKYSYTPHFCKSAGYIQELLGHKSSKTTETYTHVSTRNISRIRSPLDNLDLRKGGRNENNR